MSIESAGVVGGKLFKHIQTHSSNLKLLAALWRILCGSEHAPFQKVWPAREGEKNALYNKWLSQQTAPGHLFLHQLHAQKESCGMTEPTGSQ